MHHCTYEAAHYRVNKTRGRARHHACIDCGQPARQWSYDHTDPNEIVRADGREYSIDPAHYDPRCIACHREFDGNHRRAGVPQLHDITGELELQIREAIHHRDIANRQNDLAAVDRWDDELERITVPLMTVNYLPLAPGRTAP